MIRKRIEALRAWIAGRVFASVEDLEALWITATGFSFTDYERAFAREEFRKASEKVSGAKTTGIQVPKKGAVMQYATVTKSGDGYEIFQKHGKIERARQVAAWKSNQGKKTYLVAALDGNGQISKLYDEEKKEEPKVEAKTESPEPKPEPKVEAPAPVETKAEATPEPKAAEEKPKTVKRGRKKSSKKEGKPALVMTITEDGAKEIAKLAQANVHSDIGRLGLKIAALGQRLLELDRQQAEALAEVSAKLSEVTSVTRKSA